MWLIYDEPHGKTLTIFCATTIYISYVVNYYSKYNNGMLASQFCLDGLPVVLQGDRRSSRDP
jgi:hypothetical protein